MEDTRHFRLPEVKRYRQQTPQYQKTFGNQRTKGYTGHVPGLNFLISSVGATYADATREALATKPHLHVNDPAIWRLSMEPPRKQLDGSQRLPGFAGHVPGLYSEGMHGASYSKLTEQRKLLARNQPIWQTVNRRDYMNFFSDGDMLSEDAPLPRSVNSSPLFNATICVTCATGFTSSRGALGFTDPSPSATHRPNYEPDRLKWILKDRVIMQRTTGHGGLRKAFVKLTCQANAIPYPMFHDRLQLLGFGPILKEVEVVDLFDALDVDRDGFISLGDFHLAMNDPKIDRFLYTRVDQNA